MIRLDIEKDSSGNYDYDIRFRVHESELEYITSIMDIAFSEVKKKLMLLKENETSKSIDCLKGFDYITYDGRQPYPISLTEVMKCGVTINPEEPKDKEFDNSIGQLET